MVEVILLIILLVLGIYTVQTDSLIITIISSGSFSLVMALTYLFYNAPDVALAEAAIGVGLSTIMYLVALKKVRVYRLVYVNETIEAFNDDDISQAKQAILDPLEDYIEGTEELEAHLTYSTQSLKEALAADNDCVVYEKDQNFYIYGLVEDTAFEHMIAFLDETLPDSSHIHIAYKEEGAPHYERD